MPPPLPISCTRRKSPHGPRATGHGRAARRSRVCVRAGGGAHQFQPLRHRPIPRNVGSSDRAPLVSCGRRPVSRAALVLARASTGAGLPHRGPASGEDGCAFLRIHVASPNLAALSQAGATRHRFTKTLSDGSDPPFVPVPREVPPGRSAPRVWRRRKELRGSPPAGGPEVGPAAACFAPAGRLASACSARRQPISKARDGLVQISAWPSPVGRRGPASPGSGPPPNGRGRWPGCRPQPRRQFPAHWRRGTRRITRDASRKASCHDVVGAGLAPDRRPICPRARRVRYPRSAQRRPRPSSPAGHSQEPLSHPIFFAACHRPSSRLRVTEGGQLPSRHSRFFYANAPGPARHSVLRVRQLPQGRLRKRGVFSAFPHRGKAEHPSFRSCGSTRLEHPKALTNEYWQWPSQ